MGGVRTKTVKTTSRQVVDFHTNKQVLEEVSILPSKRLRNNLTRRISLKLQEELDFLFLKRMALLGSLMAFEVQPCSIPSPPMLFCFHRRVHVSELFPTCDGYHHLRTASEAHVADATAAAAAAAYRQYAQLGNNINYLTFSNTVCSIPRTAIWLPFVA